MRVVEQVHLPDHAAMVEYGRTLGASLGRGDVLLLHGDLGAGKTTLTQGIAKALGVDEAIQSPTFSLVAEHEGQDSEGRPLRLYHLDLYRLESAEELEGIGYDQYINPEDGVTIIEWPERAEEWLPNAFWLIRIEHAPGGGRTIERSRRE